MGAANVIPGVSGGTIAFVTGIYERLIDAIKAFDGKALKLLMARDFKGLWGHVDGGFLLALMSGVFVALLSLARLLKVGMANYPVLISALFFGLIAASVWSVFKMVKQWSVGAVVGLLIGCAVAVGIAFIPPAQENSSLIYLMICGVVAMCSMIIPGVSGSFVLILMGNYGLIMIDALSNLSKMQFKEALSILVPVGIGAVVGMAALSRVLSWLFHKFHDVAVATITGFVAGSLVTIWPWKKEILKTFENGKVKVIGHDRFFPQIDGHFWLAIGVMLAGVVLMVVIEVMGQEK